jgi:hypothetical protein
MRKSLFWFFKKTAKFDLAKQSDIDNYFQQVVTRGKASDIKQLLQTINYSNLKEAFLHTANFMPVEVRKFWEDYFGNINISAKRNS